jgi:hypothetical protein
MERTHRMRNIERTWGRRRETSPPLNGGIANQEKAMNPTLKSEHAQLSAQIALERLCLRPSVIDRIRELHGGGLADFEVGKHTSAPVDAVRLVLRVGT